MAAEALVQQTPKFCLEFRGPLQASSRLNRGFDVFFGMLDGKTRSCVSCSRLEFLRSLAGARLDCLRLAKRKKASQLVTGTPLPQSHFEISTWALALVPPSGFGVRPRNLERPGNLQARAFVLRDEGYRCANWVGNYDMR